MAASPGLGPIPVEITLKRGVWVEGKIVNRANGQPVKVAVQYYPLRDNPHLKECPDASFLNNNISDEPDFSTDAEGRFRALALPGGALLRRSEEPTDDSSRPSPSRPRWLGNVAHAGPLQVELQFQALLPINTCPIAYDN